MSCGGGGGTTSSPDNLGIQISPFPEGVPQKQSSLSSGYPVLHFLVLSVRPGELGHPTFSVNFVKKESFGRSLL